jgi:cyanophycin synthetase
LSLPALRLLDSRRVPGPGLLADEPGVALELEAEGGLAAPASQLDLIEATWRAALAEAWPRLQAGTPTPRVAVRRHQRGMTLFVAAGADVLLPLTDINEWAAACGLAALVGQPAPALDDALVEAVLAARVPGLAAVVAAAASRRLPVLIDEDAITIGGGAAQLRLPRDAAVPDAATIAWADIGRPLSVLVTGTNGKTTTTRLAARLLGEGGAACGWTSSEAVVVGGQVIARGDYSGPEGSRLVMRHPDVEVVVLETARGGILRRGLAVAPVDVAVITNVSADHLGEYGVDDVAAMADVKAVVARVARRLVLGADDPELARRRWPATATLVWFGLDPEAPHLVAHVAAGGEAYVVTDDGWVARLGGPRPARLVPVAEVAVALGGLAPHNLRNALAAAAVASACGVSDETVAQVLRTFTSDALDNPGRGNLLDVGGVTVLLDFGHNAAALGAVLGTLGALRARRPDGARLLVSIGLPGDRRDDELRATVAALAAARPDAVYVRELHGYLRGRAPGEVPALVRAALATCGASLHDVADERAALDAMLAAARPGDLVALLPHLDPAVEAALAARGAVPLPLR